VSANGLVSSLVIRFVAGSPWYMSLRSIVQLFLVLNNVLVVLCPLPVHLLVVLELNIPFVVQVVKLTRVLLPVKSVRLLLLRKAS